MLLLLYNVLTSIQIFYDKQEEELEEKETEEETPLLDEDWEPDERAVTDLQGYRIHVWDSTILGNVKFSQTCRNTTGL